MSKESIFVQLDAHMENTALGKMLKKEHEWCDTRIAELEAREKLLIAKCVDYRRELFDMREALIKISSTEGAAPSWYQMVADNAISNTPPHKGSL